jgi:hypothetical protein
MFVKNDHFINFFLLAVEYFILVESLADEKVLDNEVFFSDFISDVKVLLINVYLFRKFGVLNREQTENVRFLRVLD